MGASSMGIHSCQLAFIRGSDPVWAGWNNREWTLMDANLRETYLCQLVFIRGSNPVWAGWNNREWTLMDANLRETYLCQLVFIRGCNQSGPVGITANGH
jgi:hypothetical protein